jgi:DNA-binding CsgD family transcriptional regulator
MQGGNDMDCLECPKRATCREICPDIEAQLPGVEEGKLRLETLYNSAQENRRTDVIFGHRKRLTPRERVVLYLYYSSPLSVDDIAQGLRVTRPTVYATVHRIAEKIAALTKDPCILRRRSSRRAA